MYRPGGRQGVNQQNNYAKCTHFAGRFDDIVMWQYVTEQTA
jgi:hypothetical protein